MRLAGRYCGGPGQQRGPPPGPLVRPSPCLSPSPLSLPSLFSFLLLFSALVDRRAV